MARRGSKLVSGVLKAGAKTLRVGAGLLIIGAESVGKVVGGAFRSGRGLAEQARKRVGSGVQEVAKTTGRAAEATGTFMVELGEPFQAQAGITKQTESSDEAKAAKPPRKPKADKGAGEAGADAPTRRARGARVKGAGKSGGKTATKDEPASKPDTAPQGGALKPTRRRKPRASAAEKSPPTVH